MIELIVYLGIVISVLLLNLALIKVVNLSNPAENAFGIQWRTVGMK